MRLTRRVMLDMGASPFDVGMMIKQTCEAISFPVLHTPGQQLQLHGIMARLRRKGAPLQGSEERDLYNWGSTGKL